jgi:polysaccharide export outer membrane protein
VRTPGPYNLDDTARGVLDALNDRGGLTEFANRRVGLLSRDGQSFPVDLDALLRHGNANANALLRHGDVLHVQDNRNEKVFLLGEFKQEKVLPLDRGYMTLTEALSAGQGLDVNGSNDSAVYVFRAGDLPATQESLKDWQPQIIAVDLSKPESLLLASHFELKPRDVVYVSTAGISRYNRVIAQILPTVSTLFQLDILFRRNQ